MISRRTDVKLGAQFFKSRIQRALLLRETFYKKPFYRLIYGESDGIPGLIVDRFGDTLSLQITTAGIDKCKALLIDVLVDELSPKTMVLKNDIAHREMERLTTENEVVYGSLLQPVTIEENGVKFQVDILEGQKTGWFFDHRDSRARTAQIATNQRVLDLFSYTGAWGIPAALSGAKQVTCVDSSYSAISVATSNAHLNQVDNMEFIKQDVFDYLKVARENNQRFDLIILDPPALIKRKKDFKAGFEAYRRLNQLALQVLEKNGVLVSASCSYHLSRSNLHEILRSSARHIDRHMVFFAEGGQANDHPVHPAIPETEYLKTFFCSISSSL